MMIMIMVIIISRFMVIIADGGNGDRQETCVGSDVLFEVTRLLESVVAILADVWSIVVQITSQPVRITLQCA